LSEVIEKVIVPPHMFACLDDEGENYTVEVELPDVKKRDIGLIMDEGVVYVVAERDDLQYHGHLHFPYRVVPNKAKSKFTSGLLKVTAPLKEKRKPVTKIEIK
jgi:HSP20 family molecular chaperone IbpA